MKAWQKIWLLVFLGHFMLLNVRAQILSPEKFAKQYFVGASTFRDNQYEVFYPDGSSHLSGINDWQIVAGVWLASRWAVQVGYSYSYDLYNEDPSSSGITLSGQYLEVSTHSLIKEHATVALTRYTLIRNRLGRKGTVRTDVMLGGTLLHSWAESSQTTKLDGQVSSYFYDYDQAWQTYATGGLGLGYQYGRHLEVLADLTWSKNLKSVSAAANQQVSGSLSGLTSGFSLGLRYRFCLHIPVKTSVAP